MSATLDEFLMAAEYLLSEGNYNVMLCERGVRTFSDFSRNTLDLAVVPAVKKRSHLPILVDPSHGTGKRHKFLPLSRAAVAVGADGLIVEVHHEPDKALSDGRGALFLDRRRAELGEGSFGAESVSTLPETRIAWLIPATSNTLWKKRMGTASQRYLKNLYFH